MAPEEIAHLKGVAKAYGSPTTSDFLREMFERVLSPDAASRLTYVHGLAVKLAEQLTLPLEEKPARITRKARKKRRPRDRTT